jgi:hypothetical protein
MSKVPKRPERGPIPVARTQVDLNTDVDILQRRIGELGESATTVDDLATAGVVQRASDGSLVTSTIQIGGPQGLYDFLKGFK